MLFQPLSTTVPGVKIVSSMGNPAGNGTLSYAAPVPAVPHIIKIRTTIQSGGFSNSMTVTLNGQTFTDNAVGGQSTNALNVSSFDELLAAINATGVYTASAVTQVAYDYDFTITANREIVASVSNSYNATYISSTITTQQTYVAGVPSAFISWAAPGDTAGTPIEAKDGVYWLTSHNGEAMIRVNITPASLSANNVTDSAVAISETQIVSETKWSFRRTSDATTPQALTVTVVFASGVEYPVTLTDKVVIIDIPVESRPVSVTGVLPGAGAQNDALYISYDDPIEGRVSYANIPLSLNGTAPVLKLVTHNAPPALRTLKYEAMDRLRRGGFTGDVLDTIRLVANDDPGAYLAKIMLDDGTNYEELLSAGFSTGEATLLLSAYYSVPSGTQASRTASLSKLAVIRGMNQAGLVSFIDWANTSNIKLPVAEMAAMLGRPVYSETDLAAISAHLV